MSDPFGAIAMQRPGDLGVHIGQGSWMGSSQGIPVAITVSSPGASDSFAFVSGSQWNFIAGSIAKPVSAAQSMIKMIYTQKITSSPNVFDAQYGAALFVNLNSISGNKQQPTAGFFRSYGYADTGSPLVLGLEVKGEQTSGSGGAMGASISALSQSATANAIIGLSTGFINETGKDFDYDPTLAGNVAIGLEVVVAATSAQRHSAGILIRSTNIDGVMDTGIAFPQAAVINIAAIRDDSNSPIGLQMVNTHTWAVDVSGATLTDGWHGKLSVDNEVQITRATGSAYFARFIGTGTGAKNWGITVLTNSRFSLDEVGVATVMSVAPGTPGANKTSLYILEGAGPTLRQVTTFDPGNLGVNFTAGQLVMVAV